MRVNGRFTVSMLDLGVVLVFGVMLAVGAMAPAYAWNPDRLVTQAVIVVDISKSVHRPCEAAGEIMQEILTFPYAPTSTVMVLVTGDSSSSNEPRLVGKFLLPANRGMVEGGSRVRKDIQDLPKKITEACKNAGQTDISPVFLAIKSGLSQLHNFECGKGIRCLLFAASDGEENAEGNVKLALDGRVSHLTSLKKLDNTNVETTICGISETLGQEKEKSGATRILTKKRNGERTDRLHAVWTELFKDPARIHIYSFCPPAGMLNPSTQPNMPQQSDDLRK